MAWTTVTLVPGANVELTQTRNEAGIFETANGRFKAGQFQKLGGWVKYFSQAMDGVPKALHAWQDLNNIKRLAVATTVEVNVIASGVLSDITPQLLETDGAPDFSSTSGDATITIVDANTSGLTTDDSVYFRTPVSIGGIILSGLYPIATITGATSYTIEAQADATVTRANLDIAAITNANPGVVTYTGADNIANGDLVYIFGVGGMTQVNGRVFTVANLNAGANTFELSGVDTTAYGAYTAGGEISFAIVPEFTTTSGSPAVSVRLADHGQSVGNTVVFDEPTTVGGLTIEGKYSVTSITSVDVFVITASAAASSTATVMMNAGDVGLTYYIALGPTGGGVGYGLNDYGEGPYGLGGVGSGVQTGDPLAADDWTLDNWGEILLACPEGGAIYYWQPGTGFQNLSVIEEGPLFNNGMFVSMAQQQIIAYGSSVSARDIGGIGVYQDPMLVKWCDIGDFFEWTQTAANFAREFRISTGSLIVSGMAGKNRNLLWTDLDVHTMTYNGSQSVYSINKVAGNCGIIGKHAHLTLGDITMWMGKGNFFAYAGSGVQPVPCPVWDDVFQDLSAANAHKVVAGSNTDFTEGWFFFPSANATNPDKWAKYNTVEGTWDIGALDRTAWIDRSVLGRPIGAASTGIIYEHENGYDDDNTPLMPSFTTGYFTLANGEEFVFIDEVYPDFQWDTRDGSTPDAQIGITLMLADFPGQTPREFGPYTVTRSTPKINPTDSAGRRIRARQVAMEISSTDVGSFWRLGAVKFRHAPDGKR